MTYLSVFDQSDRDISKVYMRRHQGTVLGLHKTLTVLLTPVGGTGKAISSPDHFCVGQWDQLHFACISVLYFNNYFSFDCTCITALPKYWKVLIICKTPTLGGKLSSLIYMNTDDKSAGSSSLLTLQFPWSFSLYLSSFSLFPSADRPSSPLPPTESPTHVLGRQRKHERNGIHYTSRS